MVALMGVQRMHLRWERVSGHEEKQNDLLGAMRAPMSLKYSRVAWKEWVNLVRWWSEG